VKTVPDVRFAGVVTGFQHGRGFGFLKTPGRARDVFFHYSDVLPPGDLHDGDNVVYEVEEGTDGRLRGVRVRRVE
jgi:cold shock CspA family protein